MPDRTVLVEFEQSLIQSLLLGRRKFSFPAERSYCP